MVAAQTLRGCQYVGQSGNMAKKDRAQNLPRPSGSKTQLEEGEIILHYLPMLLSFSTVRTCFPGPLFHFICLLLTVLGIKPQA